MLLVVLKISITSWLIYRQAPGCMRARQVLWLQCRQDVQDNRVRPKLLRGERLQGEKLLNGNRCYQIIEI